jgi:hypothetical protein
MNFYLAPIAGVTDTTLQIFYYVLSLKLKN